MHRDTLPVAVGNDADHNRKDTVKSAVEAAKSVKVTMEEAWSEVEREIGVRVRVYDRWVAEQKLSWADARDRLARMGEAASILKRLCDGEQVEPAVQDADA